MTWSALTLRSAIGLRVMNMRPLLTVELPEAAADKRAHGVHRRVVEHDSRPVRCSLAMAVKEMSWAASVVPMMMPVSCCGKEALGHYDVKPERGHQGAETPPPA